MNDKQTGATVDLVDLRQTPAVLDALYRYADPGSYCALRVFPHERGQPPPWAADVKAGDLSALIEAIARGARYAAASTTPTVFCPATGCTFRYPGTAKTRDIAEGLTLAVELDDGDTAADLARLKALIGAPTLVVLSGSLWADPETGELHPKRHAYWRLSEAARDEADLTLLYAARRNAALLTGADPTGAALAHCYRWPGSLNRKNPAHPARCTVDRINPDAEIHLIDTAERLAEAIEGAGLSGSSSHKSNGAYQSRRELQADPALVAAAMITIPNPDAHYSEWVRMAYAVAGATGGTGYDILLNWSAKSSKHDAGETEALWSRVVAAGATHIGAGSIFQEAKQHGWIDPRRKKPDAWSTDTAPDGETVDQAEDAPQAAGRPVIEVQGGALPHMVAEAEAALLAAGVPIYQRAFLMRPTEQQFDAADGRKTHSAVLVAVAAPYLLKLLAKVALWRKYDGRKKKLVACNPPNDVVNILLASRGDWAFPAIRGVITCPTLRPDGSLLTASGYDRRTRYFLSLPADLALPSIPDRPSREEAEAALARLNKLLDGFPFEDEVSRSVALAILMTPVLRVAMDMSPLLGVSAKSPGTGKSFLVDLATTIALGRFCPVMGPGKDDKETEKRIDTNLISGMPVFSIDNVHRPLDLVTLNTATERPLLTIRLFGTLTNVEVENSVTIFMTGNNLAIVGEQGRRTVRACMDAKEEQPEQRDFPLGNPIEAVLKDRGTYIADILTIARAYHVSGSPRPAGLNSFGSYPGWSHFVREPLVWLGRPDPVASQEAARADDPATIKLRAVIDAWYGAFGMGAMTLAKAVQYATTPPVFINNEDMTEAENRTAYSTHKEHQEALLAALREAFGKGNAPIDTHALGNWMRAFDGRMADGLRFEKAKDERGRAQHEHGAVLWKLTGPDQKGTEGRRGD